MHDLSSCKVQVDRIMCLVLQQRSHFFHHGRSATRVCILMRISDAILPHKGIGQKTSGRLGQRCKRRPQGSHEPQGRFRAHGLSMSLLIFIHIRLRFHYFWALYLGLHNICKVPQKCRIFQPLYFRAPRLVFVLGVVL